MPLKRLPEDLDLDSSSKQARHSNPDSPYNSSGKSKASSKEEEANQPDVVQSNDPDPIYNALELESWTSQSFKDKPLPSYRVCIFKCI